MVSEAKCLLFTNNGRHFVYLKLDLATDSRFPFQLGKNNEQHVKVPINYKNQLVIEKLYE